MSREAGKGSWPRPGTYSEKYQRNYEQIDWKRTEKMEAPCMFCEKMVEVDDEYQNVICDDCEERGIVSVQRNQGLSRSQRRRIDHMVRKALKRASRQKSRQSGAKKEKSNG